MQPFGADCGLERMRELGAIGANFRQDRRNGRKQVQPPDASIPGVGPALDKTAGFKPVDQTSHRDRLDFNKTGQFVLRQARLKLKPGQKHPLCPCHAHTARPLIGASSHEAGNVVEEKKRVFFEVMGHICLI